MNIDTDIFCKIQVYFKLHRPQICRFVDSKLKIVRSSEAPVVIFEEPEKRK